MATLQDMVEIKQDSPALLTATNGGADLDPRDANEDSKHRLLYSLRSYVHPTAYSRDNIPGFIAIVKRESISPTYLLSWIPESLLDGRADFNKFVQAQQRGTDSPDSDDDDLVLVDMPSSQGEYYAFSVPVTSIYSLTATPPTFSSWYGSISLNRINGSTLPTIYFHDDESASFRAEQRASPNAPSWGGELLLTRLRSYAHLLRSSLMPNLFLVDPSRGDIEAHSTPVFDDDAVDDIFSTSHASSPIPPLRRPGAAKEAAKPRYPPAAPVDSTTRHAQRTSLLHQGLSSSPASSSSSSQQQHAPSTSRSHQPQSARTALLSSFSHLTQATRGVAQTILSHPLAKPIVPHLPDPVRSLVHADGEWESWVNKGGVGEFESARVYLAKWARIVAEEGERARQREVFFDPNLPTTSTPSPSSSSQSHPKVERSDLGVFELLHANINANMPIPKPTRDPRRPIDEETWAGWFDKSTGRPKLELEQFKGEVFRRGFVPSVRRKAWPYLLGVVPWDADVTEREAVLKQKQEQYYTIKTEWESSDEVFNREDVVEERHRIDVDCRRTDRTQPLFMVQPLPDGSMPSPQDEDGAQARSNEHVDRMGRILLTYGFYEKELGYVQGMSDLCAPLYVVCGGDEVMTFWCFVSVMDRMKINFLRDQSGMKRQLSTLQQLLRMLDPELYAHFEKTDSLNLFFCFRWVLIAFKREFPFEEVMRLWEVLWTDYYSKGMVLFVALAVLVSHRDVILRYLIEFDEVLKYCNELSMTIELDSTLAQAEVLFLSFKQIVEDIDRRQAERDEGREGLRRRAVAGSGSGAGKEDELKDVEMPVISEYLRDLLISGRKDARPGLNSASTSAPSTVASNSAS